MKLNKKCMLTKCQAKNDERNFSKQEALKQRYIRVDVREHRLFKALGYKAPRQRTPNSRLERSTGVRLCRAVQVILKILTFYLKSSRKPLTWLYLFRKVYLNSQAMREAPEIRQNQREWLLVEYEG